MPLLRLAWHSLLFSDPTLKTAALVLSGRITYLSDVTVWTCMSRLEKFSAVLSLVLPPS